MKSISFVGPLMIAGGLLALTPEAQAGDWSFSYDFTGTKVDVGTTSPWRAVAPFPQGLPPLTAAGGGTSTDGPASASTSGTITLICKWTPTSAGEMIPQALVFPTSAQATVSRSLGYPAPDDVTGSANDGVHEALGSQSWTDGQHWRKWSSNSQGLRTLPGGGKPSNGESKTWSFTFSPSASFSGSDHLSGSVSVNVGKPVEDTRTVTISRADATGEWVDSNGDKNGDTTYSYEQAPPPGPVNESYIFHKNTQNFSASVTGNWSFDDEGRPGTSRSWSPSGTKWITQSPYPQPTTDTWNSSSLAVEWGQLHQGNNQKWYGNATSPSEKTITYKVTDADGTEAEANYVLHIHDPVEVEEDLGTEGISVDVDYFDSNGQPFVDSQNPIDAQGLTTTHTESKSWSIVGTIGTELYGIPLGIEVGAEDTTGEETSRSTPSSPIVLGPGEYVNAKKRLHYNRHHVLFWKYNQNGKEKRYMSPPGPGEPDPGVPIEIPHETIWTKYSTWEFVWSEKRNGLEGGYPTTANPQPTLPPPSFKYSRKEGKKHG